MMENQHNQINPTSGTIVNQTARRTGLKYLIAVLCLIALMCAFFFMFQRSTAPGVSIVMSTYNRAAVLPAAVESMLKQTYADFEFIIIDDGSTDDTAAVIQKYADEDKRIKYIRNPKNMGIVARLNAGLRIARGKYIARMDDDDVSLPTRLEKQFDYMEKNPQVAVVSTFVSSRENTDALPFFKAKEPAEMKILTYMGITPIAHSAAFIRSDFLKKHRLKYRADYQYLEDRTLWIDIMDAGGDIAAIPEVLVRLNIQGKNDPVYYETQTESSRRSFDMLSARFSTDEAFLKLSKSKRISGMLVLNKRENILNQKKFQKMARTFVPRFRNQEKIDHIRVPQKVSAFLRVKDEIDTIAACLDSIDGVFDRIVIVHSDEPDDGSRDYTRAWCAERSNCDFYIYPHAVIPPQDRRYKTKEFAPENSMVAYNQFGVDKFEPEEWIALIDADQIYIKDMLKKYVAEVKRDYPGNENVHYAMVGYNTVLWKDALVFYANPHYKGLAADHYIIKRKNILGFYQSSTTGSAIWDKDTWRKYFDGYVFFHLRKRPKFDGADVEKAPLSVDQVVELSPEERDIYEQFMAPYFPAGHVYSADRIKFTVPKDGKGF